MSEVIKIKKGLNIKLQGKAEKIFMKADPAEKYALKPTDFHGLVPKLNVKQDDLVKAGSTLFYDKSRPEIKYSSPVSGKVAEIRRGERRKILEVIIENDHKLEHIDFGKESVENLTREKVTSKMLESGLWPFMRQRPYGIIANPEDTPKAIYISAFDTAPLAPDLDFIVTGNEDDFQSGIDAISKLTSGKVFLNIDADYAATSIFNRVNKVEITKFKGIHPAGNVGIQIHHINPINKGDVIWYLYPQDVISIGRLFKNGIYDASRIVALTGSEVHKPRYYKLISGSSITPIIKDNIKKENEVRYISGNVLTGTQISSNGFLGFYDSQITVIPEGNYAEFLGWALLGFGKYSNSRTFFSWLVPNKEYKLNTNFHGGERAFVMTGQYEKVLPMDIFPVHLLKAILASDIEKMENLGIYEVIEEDLALCEFVCTSKIEVQQILRKGLDLMVKELG